MEDLLLVKTVSEVESYQLSNIKYRTVKKRWSRWVRAFNLTRKRSLGRGEKHIPWSAIGNRFRPVDDNLSDAIDLWYEIPYSISSKYVHWVKLSNGETIRKFKTKKELSK